MYNLSIVLEDSARTRPDHTALVLGPLSLTYAQVDAAANQVANLLVSLGVEPGDRVALSCPNLPQFPIVYFGILKAGAVVVPLNVLNKAREVTYFLDDAAAKVFFCFEGTEELPIGTYGHDGAQAAASPPHLVLMTADPSAPSPVDGVPTLAESVAQQPTTFSTVQARETDTAVVLYTSGTTGRPKGAELSHSNQLMNALTCNRLFGSQPGEDTHLVDAAALPHLRRHREPQRRILHGGHAGADAPLRAPPGARTLTGPSGHRLRRGPHHVVGAAPRLLDRRRGRRSDATPTPAPRHLRRRRSCPWRSCARSATRSGSRSWRVTASPRPHRWPASPSPIAPARDPSVCRSGVSRSWASSTPPIRTGRTSLEDPGADRRDRGARPQHHDRLPPPPRGDRRW